MNSMYLPKESWFIKQLYLQKKTLDSYLLLKTVGWLRMYLGFFVAV